MHALFVSYLWRLLFRLLYCFEFTGSSSISSIASILSSESSLQYPEVRRESLLPFGEIGEEGLEDEEMSGILDGFNVQEEERE